MKLDYEKWREALEPLLGPGWLDATREEALVAVRDDMARRAAEHDQAVAGSREQIRFTRAMIEAMEATGAEHGADVIDRVVSELYGGWTSQARSIVDRAGAALSELQRDASDGADA